MNAARRISVLELAIEKSWKDLAKSTLL